jgi:hypothetical protein
LLLSVTRVHTVLPAHHLVLSEKSADMCRGLVPQPEPVSSIDDTLVDLIPLSALALDLPEPQQGWRVFLQSRGIQAHRDDVGRRSISKADAHALLSAQAEVEAEVARKRTEAEGSG